MQACDGSATPTSLMMMVPSMASCRSCRVLRTLEITRCIRSISWRKKMLMGAMAPIFASLVFTWRGERKGGRQSPVAGEERRERAIYFMWDVVCREFFQHLSSLPAHNTLPCLPSTTGAVLGLDGQDGVKSAAGQVTLVAKEDRQ